MSKCNPYHRITSIIPDPLGYNDIILFGFRHSSKQLNQLPAPEQGQPRLVPTTSRFFRFTQLLSADV